MSVSGESIHQTHQWDAEAIKAELRRKGYTLAALAREHKVARTYFSQVLVQPLPRGEEIIADILGVPAHQIWPARYQSDGRPKRGRFLPQRDKKPSKTQGQSQGGQSRG